MGRKITGATMVEMNLDKFVLQADAARSIKKDGYTLYSEVLIEFFGGTVRTFEGRVAVITGASLGIGRSLAWKCARRNESGNGQLKPRTGRTHAAARE